MQTKRIVQMLGSFGIGSFLTAQNYGKNRAMADHAVFPQCKPLLGEGTLRK